MGERAGRVVLVMRVGIGGSYVCRTNVHGAGIQCTMVLVQSAGEAVEGDEEGDEAATLCIGGGASSVCAVGLVRGMFMYGDRVRTETVCDNGQSLNPHVEDLFRINVHVSIEAAASPAHAAATAAATCRHRAFLPPIRVVVPALGGV